MNPSSYIRISHPAGLQHFVFICTDLQFVSYLLLLLVVCLVYKHTDCVCAGKLHFPSVANVATLERHLKRILR